MISRWVPTTAGHFLISGLVLTTAGRFLEARNKVRGRFNNQRTVGHFMQATNWARGIFAILILNLTEEDIRSTAGCSGKNSAVVLILEVPPVVFCKQETALAVV